MSTKAVSPAARTSLVIDPGPVLRLRRAAQDTSSVLWRDVIRTLRQPDQLAFAVVMQATS